VRKRKWSEDQLKNAVKNSKSIRSTIEKLGLIPAGGNYVQVKEWIKRLGIDSSHFTGMGWNKGTTGGYRPVRSLKEILKKETSFQSFKLKKRLFFEKILPPKCSLCGWAKESIDGRIPLELDHINGDRNDNRIENLRILCPNCHSLQPTHRGKNKKRN